MVGDDSGKRLVQVEIIVYMLLWEYLGACGVSDTNIRVILNLDWPHLEYLNLSNIVHVAGCNNLTSKGCRQLFIKEWPKLKHLELSK